MVNGQTIENIRTTASHEKVFVEYDLAGDITKKVDILVFIETRSEALVPKMIAGDLYGVLPGKNKRFEWEALKEIGPYDGSVSVKLKVVSTKKDAIDQLQRNMVFVQGGEFYMGCAQNQGSCDESEMPAHKVIVGSFYIGKFEITEAQWVAVMGINDWNYSTGCENCPVSGVSWNEVNDFLIKLNQLTGKSYRLPTEAEWEYAARGGIRSSGYQYSGSDKLISVGWFKENTGYKKKHTIGLKASNELGLYDMSGNLYEWCSDLWRTNYNSNSYVSDVNRVLRGGSTYNLAAECKVTSRTYASPINGYNAMGFRVVHSQ